MYWLVLATCGVHRLGEACENIQLHRYPLADSSKQEYNRKHSLADLHQGGTSTVQGILTFFTRLAGHGLQSLHHCYLAWTKPASTSLLLNALTDLARSENSSVTAK